MILLHLHAAFCELMLHEWLHGLYRQISLRELTFVQGLFFIVEGYGVLQQKLLTSHVKALKEQICLNSRHHVVLFLGNQVTCLDLEVLFVLALCLVDIIPQ